VSMLADAHVHLFDGGYAGVLEDPPAGPDELAAYERLRERHGIGCALVVGYEGEPRYAGNTDHVLALAAERSWIAPLGFLHVTPPTVEQLRAVRDAGGVGFAVYLASDEEGSAFAGWDPAVRQELNDQAAVLSFNARPEAIAAADAALRDLDGCAVLFSHLGLPGRHEQAPTVAAARDRLTALLALADRPNVAVKLSGAYAVDRYPHAAAQPFVDLLLEAYGPERLLWGSDFSPALDYVSFEQAAATGLLAHCSAAEVEAVMGGNLLRLLREE
jgi:L-fucono-1,5-lactonase